MIAHTVSLYSISWIYCREKVSSKII